MNRVWMIACSLTILMGVCASYAQERGQPPGPPPRGEPGQVQPPPPPPGPEGPRAPRALEQPPPGDLERSPGEPGTPLPPGPGRPRFPDPLLRLLGERRPELAERLERLRQRSPQKFREVIFEAFVSRLDEFLDAAEEGGGPEAGAADFPPREGPRRFEPGRGGGPRRGPEGPPPEDRARIEELEKRQAELEQRSHELARRAHEARAAGGSSEHLDGLRNELRAVLNEQFEVRTALRKLELEHISRQLTHLRSVLERIQGDLEQRERERAAIIDRRIEQLLGDGSAGW